MGEEPKAEVITGLLRQHHAGDRAAFDQLVSIVYDHLRRIAKAQLGRGWPTNTLSATTLVHEAYEGLLLETGVAWHDRSHFFAIAARAMRRILVDHARHRCAQKRGGGSLPIAIDDVAIVADQQPELILAVNEALDRLRGLDERLTRVVECRYFAGMTEEETARSLDTSVRTVQRDWMRARAWLMKELSTVSEVARGT